MSELSDDENVLSALLSLGAEESFSDTQRVDGVEYECEEPARGEDPVVLIRHRGCPRSCYHVDGSHKDGTCKDGQRFLIDVSVQASALAAVEFDEAGRELCQCLRRPRTQHRCRDGRSKSYPLLWRNPETSKVEEIAAP